MRTNVIAAVVVTAAAAGFAIGQSTGSGVRMMKLPLDLPAVGNVDSVKQWRLARIEQIERRGPDDIVIRFRFADGRVERVSGPHEQLAALARACGWVRTETQTVASRADYVERMVAIDADENGRIIAAMSLEPFNRDRARLRRVFSR